MAEVASLFARLGLDSKPFASGLKRAGSSLDKTAKKTDAFGKDVKGVGDDLASVGKKGKGAFDNLESGADNAKGGINAFSVASSGATLALGAVAVAATAVVTGFALVAAGVAKAATEYRVGMRDMQARTGKTGKELEALGDTAIEVYKDTFGASISDATDAVTQVTQVLGETDDALKTSAQNALLFRDVFDIAIPESLRAVRSAVAVFGTDSISVFDMMAKTIQNVGDPAGDLADTINEYSADFAQAGFSQDQFFGILEAGVKNGARNFDVMADAVREFTIRLTDGSEGTENALNDLFRLTGEGDQAFFRLTDQSKALTLAIKSNEEALKDAEGAYKIQKTVVTDLERALSDAKRELEAMARPNLKGMDEFDDRLFNLDQNAKRAKLALLDIEPDTAAYESAQKALDNVNKEIDRVSLERDLTIDGQMRAIEKATRDSSDAAITFEQHMSDIARKKTEIAGLADALTIAKVGESGALAEIEALEKETEKWKSDLATVEDQLADMRSPAKKLLDDLSKGLITEADAAFKVAEMMESIDPSLGLEKEAIGLALFGSKYEEMSDIITKSILEGKKGLKDYTGAAADAAAAASSNQSVFEILGEKWKEFIATILQSEGFLEFMDMVTRIFDDLSTKVLGAVNAALPAIGAALQNAIPLIESFVNTAVERFGAISGMVGPIFAQIGPIISGVISTLGPIFETLSGMLRPQIENEIAFFKEFFSQISPVVNDFIENIKPVLAILGEQLSILGETLAPVFDELGKTLGFVKADVDGVGEAVTTFESILNGVIVVVKSVTGVIMFVNEVISFFADGIQMAISLTDQLGQIATLVWDGIKSGIEGVSGAVGGMIGGIGSIGDKLGGIGDAIPDWLKPGSPPPLANALKDIKAGIDAMPSLSDALGGGGANLAMQSSPLAAAGGGGSSNVTVNIDGVSATNTTNGDPNTEAIRMTIQLLTQALEAA